MQKKYVVRLTDDERDQLRDVVRKLKGTSQKVKRAQILLKADVNGPRGRIGRLRRHLIVGCKPLKTFVSGWSNGASTKH